MSNESTTTTTDQAIITDPGPRNRAWRDPAEAALRDRCEGKGCACGGFETEAEREAFRAGFRYGGWDALGRVEDLAQTLAAELRS